MSKDAAPEERDRVILPYYGAANPYGNLNDPNAGSDVGFSIFDLLSLLRRRWEIVLSIVLIGTSFALAYGYTRPDIYTATAALLIESDNKIVDLDSVVEGVGSDAVAIETQINLLKSRNFLESYIENSHSDHRETLLANLALEKMKSAVVANDLQDGAVVASTRQSVPSTLTDELFNFTTFEEISKGLEVSQEGRSYIINVSYSSTDPSHAQEFANGIANHYIAEQTNRRRNLTGDASNFLEIRLEELKGELIVAEQAVQNYRAAETLHVDNGSNLTSEQLSDLTGLVVSARAARKEKEARIRYIEGLRKQGSKLESLTEVLQSPYMVTLWEEEAELRRREAELKIEFGANHPKIQTLSKEREELNQRIDLEIGRIIANAKNELEVLIAREKSLSVDIDDLENVAMNDANTANIASIQLRILEGEAAASRRIYEEFLIRFKETREQEAVVQANTRMVARAQFPTEPTGRGPMVFGLIGFVASSVIGCGLAFLRDKTDRSLRSSKEVVNTLDLPCLGQVPFMDQKKRDGKKLHEYLIEKPVSAYAESIRSIYTKLWMQQTDEQAKVIQITSSLPAEGKTTFAVSLATLLALDGKKTLLIDLDFRNPSVRREISGMKKSLSLDEFIRGTGDIDPAMIYRHEDNCDVISVKSAVDDPAFLLRSKRLRALIRGAKKSYHHVIIDSAPSLGLSDSKATFVHADTVIFVVQWNKTPLDDAVDAIEDLRACNATLSGVILTQVKVNQQSRYGYRGIDKYYGRDDNYYKN